jgi:hypothetical protein
MNRYQGCAIDARAAARQVSRLRLVKAVLEMFRQCMSIITTKDKRFLVLGYFFRHNLGDDVFLEVWKYLMSSSGIAPQGSVVVYASLEDDPRHVSEQWRETCAELAPDAVLVAGGDVLTEYFAVRLRCIMQRMEVICGSMQSVHVYGVSVAAPFESAVHLGYCDFYSKLMLRPSAHVHLISARLGMRNVVQSADLSCFLPVIFGGRSGESKETLVTSSTEKRLGVCLAAQICGSGTEHYTRNVSKLALALLDASKRCDVTEIVFIPFDTSTSCSDDNCLARDIMANMQTAKNVPHLSIEPAGDVGTVYDRFVSGRYDFMLCGRYHGHVMTILGEVPFASMCVTQKVRNLLQEIEDVSGLPCVYEPPLNEWGVPTDIDVGKVADALVYADENASRIRSLLRAYNQNTRSTAIPQYVAALRALLRGDRGETSCDQCP